MKNIVVVATGGTIAGVGEKGKTVAYHAGEIDTDILWPVDAVHPLDDGYASASGGQHPVATA